MKKRHNHTIYCSEKFKFRIDAVCDATDMSPADLVKAVFLFSDMKDFNDIILEDKDDKREQVVVKRGVNAGKTITRRPRVQIILSFKISPAILKQALTLAIKPNVRLAEVVNKNSDTMGNDSYGNSKNIDITIGIQPDMITDLKTIRDALHTLGFPPRCNAAKAEIKNRYRGLLKAYHSDTGNVFANTKRLTVIQTAWKIIDKAM